MKRHWVKLTGAILLGTVAIVAVGFALTARNPAAPEATATKPAPIAGAPTATPAPGASKPATPPPASDLLAEGKLIFMERAGGVGCQACHGVEAKGNTSVGAPDIRGKTESDVRRALGNVEMMRIVKLTDAEITAVVAYLEYLNQ